MHSDSNFRFSLQKPEQTDQETVVKQAGGDGNKEKLRTFNSRKKL